MAESSTSNGTQSSDVNVQLTCFTEESHDVTLHFQIISLTKQNNTASVTSLLGGGADSTGAGIARRLVLRTGLNIILACNIPKNSPLLEALAERILIQKLNSLGYSKDGQKRLSGVNAT